MRALLVLALVTACSAAGEPAVERREVPVEQPPIVTADAGVEEDAGEEPEFDAGMEPEPISDAGPSKPSCTDGDRQGCACEELGLLGEQVCETGTWSECRCDVPPEPGFGSPCTTVADCRGDWVPETFELVCVAPALGDPGYCGFSCMLKGVNCQLDGAGPGYVCPIDPTRRGTCVSMGGSCMSNGGVDRPKCKLP